ncbi:MAG: M10 family metallopeptidase C-terminal domain-containing protein [Pelagimonas sp.]|jgi:Ca2+-binding RTX toxin-like protein|nr:M10 family metallopeptidase C-terminal domain-containing protein [Pelagimonas sp.]
MTIVPVNTVSTSFAANVTSNGLFLLPDRYLISTGTTAVYASVADVEIHGTVHGDYEGINASFSEIFIGDSGSVSGRNSSAIWVPSPFEGSDRLQLVNNGEVTNSNTAPTVGFNGWTFDPALFFAWAGSFYNTTADITNFGLISNTTSQGAANQSSAIEITTAFRVNITNGADGVISAQTVNGSTIRLLGYVWDGNQSINTVINHGQILSANQAYLSGSFGIDRFTNTGLVQGDILLGAEDDVFTNDGGQVIGTVFGGDGDDLFVVDDGTLDLVELSGEGTDTVVSSDDFQLSAHFENLELAGSADLRGTGNGEDNTITGNTGDNVLSGRDGNDDISGGAGNDLIRGGGNKDTVDGGSGDDDIRLGAGGDQADGGEGDDVIQGRSGKDALQGGAGEDTLLGGGDADTLNGGDQDDVLIGGGDADRLTGGDGADHFVWQAVSDSNEVDYDSVLDFVRGEDLIDLRDLVEGTLTLNLLGSFSGGGVASIRTVETGGDTRINIDVDGDGSRDMRIDVTGVTGMDGTDFLL